MFSYFFIVLGTIGAIIITPLQLQFIKGLQRLKKLKTTETNFNDYHASNIYWTIAYCLCVLSLFYGFYMHLFKFSFNRSIDFLLTTLSYPFFFANILEYFNLSKYHQRKIIFWVGITVLWVMVPIFVAINYSLSAHNIFLQYLASVSPFSNGWVTNTPICAIDKKGSLPSLSFPYIVPLCLAALSFILAFKERASLKQKILKD